MCPVCRMLQAASVHRNVAGDNDEQRCRIFHTHQTVLDRDIASD